mmetsp:Transcript_10567/g.24858  ORF Transcript_10567/g.24858 Transcript_10567/m.24858 type:complete len:109 (-) Transcript_10567:1560-1886(-)
MARKDNFRMPQWPTFMTSHGKLLGKLGNRVERRERAGQTRYETPPLHAAGLPSHGNNVLCFLHHVQTLDPSFQVWDPSWERMYRGTWQPACRSAHHRASLVWPKHQAR